MFHVCNKFRMPSYCGLIGLSVSIKQKAKDNFRNVTTLLIFILRSLALEYSSGEAQNVQLKISLNLPIRRYIILSFYPVNI